MTSNNAPRASLKIIGSGFFEVFALNRCGIEGNEFIDSGLADLWRFAGVEQSHRAVGGLQTDQARGVGFDDDGILVGSVPGPVHFVSRDSLEVALLAVKTLFLDKEPNFAFLNV